MDKTIRRIGLQEMKAEEYAYWQSRPSHERMTAATELTTEQYARKDPLAHVSRLRTIAVLLKR